jgi:hypothetical protein
MSPRSSNTQYCAFVFSGFAPKLSAYEDSDRDLGQPGLCTWANITFEKGARELIAARDDSTYETVVKAPAPVVPERIKGWYLLAPPFGALYESRLSQWDRIVCCDTAAACEKLRAQLLKNKYGGEQRMAFSRCVSCDDPRLKKSRMKFRPSCCARASNLRNHHTFTSMDSGPSRFAWDRRSAKALHCFGSIGATRRI